MGDGEEVVGGQAGAPEGEQLMDCKDVSGGQGGLQIKYLRCKRFCSFGGEKMQHLVSLFP